jgi:outer membrane protein W
MITAPLFRYGDMFGLRLLGHYYLLEGQAVQPYLGGGIGCAWAYGFQQTADLSTAKSNFNFMVSPEVGVLVQLVRGATSVGLNLAARYTFTTATFGKYRDAQTVSGIAGLMWSY